MFDGPRDDEYDTTAEAQVWLVIIYKATGRTDTAGPFPADEAAQRAMHINDPKLAVFIVEKTL